MMIRRTVCLLSACALLSGACASPPTDTLASPRLYIFENGHIRGLDPQLFNFTREELAEVDFVNTSYLIVHPGGSLMFEAGAIPDSHISDDGTEVREGIVSASRSLRAQMAAAGYAPENVTWFAMSHYHSDHTANANDFAGATWIVQRAERDWMFAESPQGIIQPAHYSALRTAKTQILEDEDFDVFGDGTVIVMSTPGHTPGHQSVFVRLANTGPVFLSGDLYHYPEEITLGRVPTFEFDAEQTRRTRARVERFVQEQGARIWIEHDIATHAALPKAPAFLD